VAEVEQAMNFYAIQTVIAVMQALDTCRTGSAFSAAKTAENVINKLDYQVSDDLIVDSYSDRVFSDGRMKAELVSQTRMLDYLQENPCLRPDQRSLFREEKGNQFD
jgi:hypothetical protein